MNRSIYVMAGAVMIGAACAQAQVWPRNMEGSMKHIDVMMDPTGVDAHVMGDPLEVIQLTDWGALDGVSYTPPADVLNGMAYSNRYGWNVGGLGEPPPGASVWVELVSQTPGLEVYEGGMRMTWQSHTYAPILGTGGSANQWEWSGVMTHNWYAAAAPGPYEATYRVYFGDAMGVPLGGMTDSEVTLYFNVIPAPAGAVVLSLLGLVGVRRQR